jgi:hypothetical protein
MTPQLGRLLATLRHPDAVRPDEVFPRAQREAILAAIVATGAAAVPPIRLSHRPRLRMRVALPVAGLAAAALATALVVALQSPQAVHAAGIAFRHPTSGPDRGYIIATVTDPYAAQASLDAAFKQAGLDIEVTLVPASPSAVGTVVAISGPSKGPQIEALTGGSCVTGGGGPGRCPIGVKIPRDFTGSAAITLGRPAKSGEQYESTNDAFAPGEVLHCSRLLGKTVAVASAELANRGITVEWRGENGDTQPPPNEYVADGAPIGPGIVLLFAQPTPLSKAIRVQFSRMYNAGCS